MKKRINKGNRNYHASISCFYGIIVMMFFDEHNPPHFHVRYNEYKAIININDGLITGTLPRRVVNLVYEWLDLHKEELLTNWNLLKANHQPNPITPLD